MSASKTGLTAVLFSSKSSGSNTTPKRRKFTTLNQRFHQLKAKGVTGLKALETSNRGTQTFTSQVVNTSSQTVPEHHGSALKDLSSTVPQVLSQLIKPARFKFHSSSSSNSQSCSKHLTKDSKLKSIHQPSNVTNTKNFANATSQTICKTQPSHSPMGPPALLSDPIHSPVSFGAAECIRPRNNDIARPCQTSNIPQSSQALKNEAPRALLPLPGTQPLVKSPPIQNADNTGLQINHKAAIPRVASDASSVFNTGPTTMQADSTEYRHCSGVLLSPQIRQTNLTTLEGLKHVEGNKTEINCKYPAQTSTHLVSIDGADHTPRPTRNNIPTAYNQTMAIQQKSITPSSISTLSKMLLRPMSRIAARTNKPQNRLLKRTYSSKQTTSQTTAKSDQTNLLSNTSNGIETSQDLIPKADDPSSKPKKVDEPSTQTAKRHTETSQVTTMHPSAEATTKAMNLGSTTNDADSLKQLAETTKKHVFTEKVIGTSNSGSSSLSSTIIEPSAVKPGETTKRVPPGGETNQATTEKGAVKSIITEIKTSDKKLTSKIVHVSPSIKNGQSLKRKSEPIKLARKPDAKGATRAKKSRGTSIAKSSVYSKSTATYHYSATTKNIRSAFKSSRNSTGTSAVWKKLKVEHRFKNSVDITRSTPLLPLPTPGNLSGSNHCQIQSVTTHAGMPGEPEKVEFQIGSATLTVQERAIIAIRDRKWNYIQNIYQLTMDDISCFHDLVVERLRNFGLLIAGKNYMGRKLFPLYPKDSLPLFNPTAPKTIQTLISLADGPGGPVLNDLYTAFEIFPPVMKRYLYSIFDIPIPRR